MNFSLDGFIPLRCRLSFGINLPEFSFFPFFRSSNRHSAVCACSNILVLWREQKTPIKGFNLHNQDAPNHGTFWLASLPINFISLRSITPKRLILVTFLVFFCEFLNEKSYRSGRIAGEVTKTFSFTAASRSVGGGKMRYQSNRRFVLGGKRFDFGSESLVHFPMSQWYCPSGVMPQETLTEPTALIE
jgi:hypothetical protein